MATLTQALERFNVVTVIEPTFQALEKVDGAWVDSSATPFTLDTLQISNFTQEGPSKESRGGINAEIVSRYGMTARLEMEDVIGRQDVLEQLMAGENVAGDSGNSGSESFTAEEDQNIFTLSVTPDSITSVSVNGSVDATAETDIEGRNIYVTPTTPFTGEELVTIEYDYTTNDSLRITDKFAGMFRITGRTFLVDPDTGDRNYINIIIHKFLPDSLFNLTMEAEGDFGVMNIAGELFTNDCGVFYEFSEGTQPAEC